MAIWGRRSTSHSHLASPSLELSTRCCTFGRQAPRAWNEKLHTTLCALGFEQSPYEPAIYMRTHDDSLLLLGVYVDDLIITRLTEVEINRFEAEIKARFRMSDLGLISFYFGIEVQQNSDGSGITLCQAHYAKRILEVSEMQDCNPAHTPMEERLKLSRDSMAAEVDVTLYRGSSGAFATSSTCG